MFFMLLLVTLLIAVTVSVLTVKIFDVPVGGIFARIIQDKISTAWQKYVRFAGYVTGISGGVRIYMLERFITPPPEEDSVVALNAARWTLEVYRTIIGTLQGIAWMYLAVFLSALLAFAIVRGCELKFSRGPQE